MKKRRFQVGNDYFEIPDNEVDSFLVDFPKATEVRYYELNGSKYNIPLSEADAFETDMGLKKKEPSQVSVEPSLVGAETSSNVLEIKKTLLSNDVIGIAKNLKRARTDLNFLQNNTDGIYDPENANYNPNYNTRLQELTSQEGALVKQLNEAGYDADEIASEFADVPQGTGFDVNKALQLKKDNKHLYNRYKSVTKWWGGLFENIRKKEGDNAAPIINELIEGQSKHETRSDVRADMRNAIGNVYKYIDDVDKQKEIIGEIIKDKGFGYGLLKDADIENFADDERYSGNKDINYYHINALQFLEDTDPAAYQSYSRLLSIKKPENGYDPKLGFEKKARQLESLGMNLESKALEEKLTDYQNRIDKGETLTTAEADEAKKLYEQYETLKTDMDSQEQRYPEAAKADADELMQESIGQRNNPFKKTVLKTGENVGDVFNFFGDAIMSPFRSKEERILDDLEDFGSKEFTKTYQTYTTDANRLIKSDGTINLTASAWANTVSDVASEIISQAGIALTTGGAGNLSKVGKFTKMFGTVFATTYQDYYAEAIRNNEPNPSTYAAIHTAIEASTELINNDLDMLKKTFGTSSPLGQIVKNISKEQFESIAQKSSGRFIKALGETGKNMVGNAYQESKEELAGQVAGNIVDDKPLEEGLKETLVNTFLGTLPLGIPGAITQYSKLNRTDKYALYDAAQNYDKSIASLDEMVKDGTFTEEKAIQIKSVIDKAAAKLGTLPKADENNEPIADNDKADMLAEAMDEEQVQGEPEQISQPIELEINKGEQVDNSADAPLVREAPNSELTAGEQVESGGNVETNKAVMVGSRLSRVEVNNEMVDLPEEGFVISDVYLKDGEKKGVGSGQEIYLKALEEHGVLYSFHPISEDALRVQNKLVEKGVAEIKNTTLKDGTEVRVISNPNTEQKVQESVTTEDAILTNLDNQNKKTGLEATNVNEQPKLETQALDPTNPIGKPPKPPKAGDSARNLAQKIRSGKINKLGGFKTSTGFDAVWDASLEVVATTLEATGNVADAIEKGLSYIKQTDWYKKLSNKEEFDEKYKAHLEKEHDSGEGNTDGTETENDDESTKRRFSKQVLNDENMLPAVKEGVRAAMDYTRQTNTMSVQEAQQVLDRVGVDKAYDLVVNDTDLKPAVRVVLGEILIKKYNDLATKAKDKGDTETENEYTDKAIAVATYVSERFGTEAGQMIQALSLFSRLTPEAQLRAATKQVKKATAKTVEKRRKDVEDIGRKLQQANEEAAEEVTKSVKTKKAASNAENKRVKKAKDKIQAAREKRANILKRYKNKGGNLYSGIGLTQEGIEFVGEMAATYIQEGVAQLEIVVEKIKENLKGLSGKEPNDQVVRDVVDIAKAQFDKANDKKIAQGLSELEKEVNKIIKEHYTIPDDGRKKTLADKFINGLGLDKDDAEQLSKEIQDEFDKIATRKKLDILEKEKTRLTKIHKDLDRGNKVEKRKFEHELIRYSNLGAFDDKQFFELIANKLGVGQLTTEEAKKIKELADKIQKAPEGSPKREATQDLLAYMANMKGVSWMEVGQAIWYANILSGYKTHIVNIVSTFFNGMAFFGAEAFRHPRSIPVLVYGGLRGLRRGGFEAVHTITTGRSPIHVSKVETPATLERVNFVGGFFNPYNWLKFVGRLMVAEDIIQFQGLKEMRATQLAYKIASQKGYKNPFSKQTWNQIEQELLNTKERSDEAIVQAEKEGAKKGSVEWKRRVYEIMENSRPIQMTEQAYGFAAKGTFNHEPEGTLGAITNAISHALNIEVGGVRPLRFLVPFTRIITNVVNNSIDFTPLGYLRVARGGSIFGGSKFREMTAEDKKQVIARASLGLAMTSAIYALSKVPCKDGHNVIEITGGGTGDFGRDAQLKESGWRPYSIRICGGSYISYKFTPLVFNLSFLGYLNDNEKYGKDDDETVMMKIMTASYQTGQLALDGTWVGSTTDLNKTLAESSPSQLASNVGKTVSRMAQQMVLPNAYVQGAQRVEEILGANKKDAKTFWQKTKEHIPIARSSLNDKINALGEPIKTDNDIFVSERNPHKVWDFLHSRNVFVGTINPNSFIVWDAATNEERKGTTDEFYEFSKLRGQKIKEKLEVIIDNGAFVNRDDEVTTSENIFNSIKASSALTEKEVKKLLKAISTDASKEAKETLNLSEPKKKSIL